MKNVVFRIIISLAAMGAVAVADLETCGDAQYAPTQYVCYDNNFLCPIVAGEPLSYCSGACYSKFMYACNNNALSQLPQLAAGTPFTLTASNPAVDVVDGLAVAACGRSWSVGGQTCSYCPSGQVPACPTGDTTVISAGPSMDVEVPGGQQVYLDPFWGIGYTQAHSASIPPGSTLGGLVAYENGGFINLNSGGWGWVACPPTAAGGGGQDGYTLKAVNATNQVNLSGCTPVNLKVKVQPSGTVGAWQYT